MSGNGAVKIKGCPQHTKSCRLQDQGFLFLQERKKILGAGISLLARLHAKTICYNFRNGESNPGLQGENLLS